ncbi:hypothetical protein C8R44DRAFT_888403 [Mycena epipterygia]|nr:hypothetical protein C8R44DRAFT_888403 [Mycena epipterygia]
MCDTFSTVKTTVIFSALSSLMSGTTLGYICLGLACASLAMYAVHHQMPSEKLARLEDAIKVVEGVLKRAKSECAMGQVDLLDAESHFLQANLLASEIQTQMLEAGGVTLLFKSNVVLDRSLSARVAACCESLKKYLQGARGITRSIRKCRKEVEETHTSTLRIIQEERRRKLLQAIRGAQEDIAVLRSPIGYVHPTRHRSVGNLLQESYMPVASPKCFQPVSALFVVALLFAL